MLKHGLATEIKWFIVLFVIVAIFGFSFGYTFQFISLYLVGYILWLFKHIQDLQKWVDNVQEKGPTFYNFSTVWAEIADDVSRLYRRNQRDKKKMRLVVARIRNMTTALDDGVVILDRYANIDWWNTAAQKLFQFQEMDRGHRIENVMRNPAFIQYFNKQDYENPLNIPGLRNENQRLEFRIHPYGAGERLVIVRDITRIQKLEGMRKDFVANVSHELRTPLTVIRGYIETFLDMPGVPAPLEKGLTQMQQHSQRMTNLINDLITLSRLETDAVDQLDEEVYIDRLVDRVLHDAQTIETPFSHTFERSGGDGLVMIGSTSQLQSVFSNLVYNAVKYAQNDCHITVKIRKYGSEFLVSVRDTGPGIDAKHIPRLTERFYRVDDGRATTMGGTGLGLAIVKHVLLRHEAELRIRSRLGKGSTFTCHFPRTRLQRTSLDDPEINPLPSATDT